MAATKKQRTQRVIREVKAAYADQEYLNDQELFAAFDHFDYPVVYWEAGPFEWAIDLSFKLNEKFRAEGVDIFVEPQYSFALAVFGAQ